MKQVGQGTQRLALHGVLLYLEEFFSILTLFKQNCDVVKVTADGFALDDPETEVSQLASRLNRSEVFKLDIEGSQFLPGQSRGSSAESEDLIYRTKYPPLASLSLQGESGSLEYDADDPRAKGLSTWILERLTHRKIARLFGERPWLFAIGGLVWAVLIPVPWWLVLRFLRNRTLAVSLDIAWCLLLLAWGVRRTNRFLDFNKAIAVLRLEYRSQRRNFFARNKDQLALIVITSLLSATLTLVITLFVQSLETNSPGRSSTSTVQNTK
jgi:hypothetical protein